MQPMQVASTLSQERSLKKNDNLPREFLLLDLQTADTGREAAPAQ